MNILITGASGFVGASLKNKLKKSPHKIFFVTSKQCDISSLKQVQRLRKKTGKIDQLVHLAAYVPKKAADDSFDLSMKVNVIATANILSVFGKDLRSLVLISTGEVYKLQTIRRKLNESSQVDPRSYYAMGKVASEYMCQTFCQKNSTTLTILRLTTLYGADDTINRAIPNFIRTVQQGQRLTINGSGKDVRDYLHVDDAVQAILLAMKQKGGGGIINIASGDGITVRDLAKFIQETAQIRGDIQHTGKAQPPTYIQFDISKAKKLLGFRPRKTLRGWIRSLGI